MKKILVVGSLNTDFAVYLDKMPKPGETVNAEKLIQSNGGKGANQGYTIGKLGGDVAFLGCVGKDDCGKALIESLESVGVDTTNIEQTEKAETGKAFIYIDKSGQNSISIIHGANYLVTKEFVMRHKKAIDDADIILMQLEIPLEAVETVLKLAKGKTILLDPAPANREVTKLDLENIFLVKPNETEMMALTNAKSQDEKDLLSNAHILLEKGIKNVLVSFGSKGSFLINEKGEKFFPSFPAVAVDTTAAGDSFIGSIALGLSKNWDLEESINFATKVSSLVVSKKGAQSSIPSLDEVLKLK